MQSDAYFSASAIVANDLDSQRPDVVSQRTWRVICRSGIGVADRWRLLSLQKVTVSPACLGSYLSPNRVALSRVARGLRSCAALVAG
jgi:hypothetical protein